MAIIGSIIALGVITPLVGGSTVTAFTSGVSRDATLTGRTDIWAGLLPDVTQHPLFGYGFGSFWTAARIYQHDIGEAHNGYLEVCLGLGFVGVYPYGDVSAIDYNKAATLMRRDYDWGALCICVLVMTAIHNIPESSAESFTSYLMANVLFLSVCMPGIPIVLQGKNSSLEIPVVGNGELRRQEEKTRRPRIVKNRNRLNSSGIYPRMCARRSIRTLISREVGYNL